MSVLDLAGVLSAARLGVAQPGPGQNFETFAIASAIIGGTSFFGGRGRIPSVVVGGLIIAAVSLEPVDWASEVTLGER